MIGQAPTFLMSDGDIALEYKQAKNPKEQIKILADQNLVSVAAMREKLRSLGVLDGQAAPPAPAPHVAGVRRKPPMDELRAMELYREGLDDLAIAEALGEAKSRIVDWRKRMHLRRPMGGAAQKKREKEMAVPAVESAADEKQEAGSAAENAPRGKALVADGEKKPEVTVRMTVEGLARMLDTAAKLGGTVELQVAGQPLCGAEILIRCGSDGEPEHTVLRLEI